jgi:hypothetical protein
VRTLTIRLNSSNQIEVRCGTESRCGECHYLEMGATESLHSTIPSNPTRQLLESSLQQLLREWLTILKSLQNGELVWLPFDFSDESTRWLAVHRTGHEAALVFGWARVEGWAIDPANIGELARGLRDFIPDDPLVVQSCELAALITDIEAELSNQSQRNRP